MKDTDVIASRMEQISELDRLLLITEATESVDGFTSLEDTISRLCSRVLTVMNCDYACVRMPDEGGSVLRIIGSTDAQGFAGDEVIDLHSASFVGPVPGHRPPSVDAYLGGRIQVVSRVDAQGDAPWQKRFRELRIASMLCLPLVRRSAVLGVLNCYWMREFTPDDAQLLTLQVVGRLSVLAIESARRAELTSKKAAENAVALSQSDEQRIAAAALARAQSELAECCASPPAAALAGVARVLADTLGGAVAIADRGGDILAADGAADEVRVLENGGGGRLPLGAEKDPFGTLLHSRRGDMTPMTHDILRFARRLLVAVLARRTDEVAAARGARPYALLAACSGMLSPEQVVVTADMLGVGAHARLELAVLRFETSADAGRAASAPIHHLRGWSDAITAVPVGGDLIVLLGNPSANSRRPLERTRYPGLLKAGISDRFTGLHGLPGFLRQARYAATAAAEGVLVRYANLGPAAELFVHLPRAEAEAIVNRRLGALSQYDAEHRTDLLRTLAVFVDSAGSTERSATELLVHRNTVHQRLRRITALTGFDVTSYRDIAEMVTLLQWKQFLDAELW